MSTQFLGRIGADLSVEDGRRATRLAALNALALAEEYLGSLDTVTGWADHLKIDMSRFPKLQAFQKAVFARGAVQEAMREEGLIS